MTRTSTSSAGGQGEAAHRCELCHQPGVRTITRPRSRNPPSRRQETSCRRGRGIPCRWSSWDPQGNKGACPCPQVRRLHAWRDVPGGHPAADVGVSCKRPCSAAGHFPPLCPVAGRSASNMSPRPSTQSATPGSRHGRRSSSVERRPRRLRSVLRAGRAAPLFAAVPVLFLCVFLLYPLVADPGHGVRSTGRGGTRPAPGFARRRAWPAPGWPAPGRRCFPPRSPSLLGLPAAYVFSRYDFPGEVRPGYAPYHPVRPADRGGQLGLRRPAGARAGCWKRQSFSSRRIRVRRRSSRAALPLS